jgi:hypothetical protein
MALLHKVLHHLAAQRTQLFFKYLFPETLLL